jgi:hypothetical protein
MDISRRRSEAQPPGQTKKDFSRPGRDAGPEFATEITQVRRPFRARAVLLRSRWLRFAPPPANVPRASSAEVIRQQYQAGLKK